MDKYKPIITLDWGMLQQSSGRIDEACRCYMGAADLAGKQRDQELRVLAILSNCFLMLSTGEKKKIDLVCIVLIVYFGSYAEFG
jgi:hypothetical protein